MTRRIALAEVASARRVWIPLVLAALLLGALGAPLLARALSCASRFDKTALEPGGTLCLYHSTDPSYSDRVAIAPCNRTPELAEYFIADAAVGR